MKASHPSPSRRLAEVRYEIRGELARHAHALEAQGHEILRLNIGNPGRFGFRTPEHVREAVARGLPDSEAYCHQQGLLGAREAIVRQQQARGAPNVHVDRVFIGNGVSELIDLALRALLDDGDEVLVPAPDYPLWTASVILNGGRAVHYRCEETTGYLPDPDQVASLITPRTRALVIINPNNPTGAVYPCELLQALAELATRHRLLILCDEIYDGIVYDQAVFHPVAAMAPETLCVSFGGLSKVHRACGYRVGWISLSGHTANANDYLHALDLLSALRLCGNVPGQWAVEAALEGPDSISALCAPGGRLHETRRAVLEGVAASPWLRLAPPAGALYAFPGVDRRQLPHFDDHAFALDLLQRERVLVVPGNSFNIDERDHFRITLLPEATVMREVFRRIDRALSRWVEARQAVSA